VLGVSIVLSVAACGGGGDGEEGLSLAPTSGSPGSAVTVRPACEKPPLVTEWVSPSGLSSIVASTEAQSKYGLTSVPGDAVPGTYTVTVTCGNVPAPVGQTTFEVTS
jgi:hypothetical protein